MSSGQPLNEYEGTNALSCDNEDASSIASLMSLIEVIEELMRRVQRELELSEPPKPCEYFKLMVGAGFSGLLVILLGRLGMSVAEAKKSCNAIMDEAFSERKILGSEAFKIAKLRGAVENMLKMHGVDMDTYMLDHRAGESRQCKVMVCVSPAGGMRAGVPTYLRTYSVNASSLPDCTIVEAVCATFAVPGLFKAVDIVEPGGIRSAYVGLGSYNPMVQLLDEAASMMQNGQMACVTSIGAEQEETSGTSRYWDQMNRRLIYATDEQGMETIRTIDWEKRLDGAKHAQAHLRLTESNTILNAIVKSLVKRDSTISMMQLRGIIPVIGSTSHTIKQCPPPSALFVGRGEQLETVRRCLVGGGQQRRVCVVHGLGGVGKTQLALKFVELYGNDYRHIFYIDSTSANTIDADLKSIAVVKNVGEFANDALTWLAHLKESWLIVYNNADNTSLNLRGHFPACSHGSILVTTRNRGMINLAHSADAACHMEKMLDDEAQELLAKASGGIEIVGSASANLVRVVGYFPLAIVQAGAYIRTHMCTIDEYLDMYHSSRGQILEEYADEVQKLDDYELTVYATWRLSYQQLHPIARQLFDVLAFMHHDQITEDIFRFAVLGLQYEQSPLPPTEQETKTEQVTSKLLENFMRLADGAWDKAAFLRTVNNLASYSLLAYDSVNKWYSIHPLVQQWSRIVVTDPGEACSCAAVLLTLSVTSDSGIEGYAHRLTLLRHIDALPDREKLRPRLAWRLQVVYRDSGHEGDEEKMARVVHEANMKLFGRHSEHSLESMNNLATTYLDQGRWAEAEVLQQEVVEVGKQVSGSEHPHTLTAIGNLAMMYSNQGRWAEAEVLQQEVVEVWKRVSGSEHLDTLRAMNNLAMTYSNQGRWVEAEVLLQEVAKVWKRALGSEHPYTLLAMSNLAMTYSNQGRWAEAEVLQQEVVEVRKRVSGSEHSDTLLAMNNLATMYLDQGRWAEAEMLQREVVEIRKRVSGSEHPQTLTAIGNLALTYSNQGRWTEAEALQQELVEVRKRVTGSEHPDTLLVMGNLAATYSSQGRWAEAEVLGREVVEVRKRVSGGEHPYTLLAMSNLAGAYSNQGRRAEAEVLYLEVLQIRKRVSGSKHPDTLLVMGNLAAMYSEQGRWAEAEALEREVLEARKRVLGREHPHTLLAMDNLAWTYSSQEQWGEVEVLHQEVFEIKQRVLDSEHPDTLAAMGNLGRTYSRQGRWVEARALQQRLFEVGKRVWGHEHPQTLLTMHLLAVTLGHLGELQKAESLALSAVDGRKSKLGDSHPSTIESIQVLEDIRRKLKETQKHAIGRSLLLWSVVLVFLSWLAYMSSAARRL